MLRCKRLLLQTQNKRLLDRILEYTQEKGLFTLAKSMAFSAVSQIAMHQPEHRSEVIEWFRCVINFALTTFPQNQHFDRALISFLICSLMDIKAIELIPEIKALFDAKHVQIGGCGTYEEVCQDLDGTIDQKHQMQT